jgi:hypothetical protein
MLSSSVFFFGSCGRFCGNLGTRKLACMLMSLYAGMQVLSMYGGQLEFLFVVESMDDPAYQSVSLLINELEVCLWVFHISGAL